MMNGDDGGTTTDANGLGSTVFIRMPIVESRGAHVRRHRRRALTRRRSRTLPLPSLPHPSGCVNFLFVQYGLRLLRPRRRIMPRLPDEGRLDGRSRIELHECARARARAALRTRHRIGDSGIVSYLWLMKRDGIYDINEQ